MDETSTHARGRAGNSAAFRVAAACAAAVTMSAATLPLHASAASAPAPATPASASAPATASASAQAGSPTTASSAAATDADRGAAANAAMTAAAPKLPSGVVDQSFVRPDGERVLQLSAVVDGPPSLAWNAFATSDGFSAWAVAIARVDLRVGGEIESSYDASVPLGSGRTIRNQILAFVPERVLAIRNVQTPPNAPFDGPTFQELQTVVLFEAEDANHTRITLVNGGYREGPKYDDVYRHFRAGNAYTLAVLRKHLAKLAATPSSGAAPPSKATGT